MSAVASLEAPRGSIGHLSGATACGGRYTLDGFLFGSPDESVWTSAREPALVTIGLPTGLGAEDLARVLALPVSGVAPLLTAGALDDLGTADVIAEELPAGVPSPLAFAELDAGDRARAACLLGLAVGAVTARAHAAGSALGGLRPDAVWVAPDDPGRLTAIAPRATRLWALRRPVDSGVVSGHLACYRPPEALAGAPPDRAGDVFSLAAAIAWWATGDHPYGDDPGMQPFGILGGQRGAWRGPESLGRLIDAMLVERDARPDVGRLREALSELQI